MSLKFFTFSRFTLLIALCISAIAAYYSVLGLATIFAGAVIPIIVMGTILEIAKITTTVWLHTYWERAGYAIKTYLTAAVIVLAFLTSMGIFGLLSKAHSDQGLVSGDVGAQLALIDEKIKTQRDNIEVARKALQQLDAQVDARLNRGDSEAGAERAVQIRRQQAPERSKLQREIGDAQKAIATLNEERAPIAAKNRKVEAEVGPIKYIAALIYGDNPDANLLERAVRWVTILIVVVFDPLAIVLILAANNSIKWDREKNIASVAAANTEPHVHGPDCGHDHSNDVAEDSPPAEPMPSLTPDERQQLGPLADVVQRIYDGQDPREVTADLDQAQAQRIADQINSSENTGVTTVADGNFALNRWTTNYTLGDYNIVTSPALAPVESPVQQSVEQSTEQPAEWPFPAAEPPTSVEPTPVEPQTPVTPAPVIQTEGVTELAKLYHPSENYVMHEGKNMSIEALRGLRPDLLLSPDSPVNQILWGTEFPSHARSGDIYIRVDVVPHAVFKFNGVKWIALNKHDNTTYLQNTNYVNFLISKLESGEYDPELLTDGEQDEIQSVLQNTGRK